MSQPTGQKNEVRICRDIVPKTNMDAPDRYVRDSGGVLSRSDSRENSGVKGPGHTPGNAAVQACCCHQKY